VIRPLGLRLRLTVSYAILYAPLLIAVGLIFYQTFFALLRRNAEDALGEEWPTIRKYLEISDGKAAWKWNRDDNEEAYFVRRVRRILLIADTDGKVIEISDGYEKRLTERTVVLKSGPFPGQDGRVYRLVLGRDLGPGEMALKDFTRGYFLLLPVLIAGLAYIGWLLAARALAPVRQLAATIQQVSGNNLGVRPVNRGTGDELDFLIDRFNDMVDRLQGTLDQARLFSMDVSHELRSPLTMARGELDVALMSQPNTEHYREAMIRCVEAIDNMTNVIRSLLHLSQAESGQLVLAREQIDLAVVAQSACERYQIPAEMGGIVLTAEADAACLVTGDRVQLDRLINNLLSNAVNQTRSGGSITIRVAVANGRPEVSVADTGRGIAPEHLSRIFERFYRVPDATSLPGAERGTGLGLSFVAWIAKAHGAEVLVDSVPGQGSTFRVRFPAVTLY